ncbi:MAG: hypothetical protein ACYC5H_18315 [Methylovirgula sp.]
MAVTDCHRSPSISSSTWRRQPSSRSSGSADAASRWRNALELARDVVATLNVEPYFAMSYFNTPTLRLEPILRELALFDHLFVLRQWRPAFTRFFLSNFFESPHDAILTARLGWGLSDLHAFVGALEYFSGSDPNVINVAGLSRGGISRQTLLRMLPFFAHAQDSVNVDYLSPLSADRANLMFRPLMRFGPEHLLLPADSLVGPAIYEAAMAALRDLISRDAANDLTGAGAERVTAALFARSSLHSTHTSAEYRVGTDDEGECDLVYESDKTILFVECKAKPLTRGAMAGVSGDALLDFAGGMFSAQKQALTHERMLRANGRITFEDGTSLDLNKRKIFRLSVTLLDHGALQDRMMLVNLYGALAQAQVSASPRYGKAKQVKDFNKALDNLRREIELLEGLGVPAQNQPLNTASFSVGQLDVLLDAPTDLDVFCQRITRQITFATRNRFSRSITSRVLKRDVCAREIDEYF